MSGMENPIFMAMALTMLVLGIMVMMRERNVKTLSELGDKIDEEIKGLKEKKDTQD